jgi:lipoprotein-anchoring transpeptidase ErfK/SrfK
VRGKGAGGNVRIGPGTIHEVVGFLGPSEVATILGSYRDWWKIDYGGEVAWIAKQVVIAENAELVGEVDPGTIPGAPPHEEGPVAVVGASKVNVRAGPGSDYLRIGTLDPGAYAPVLGRHDGWWQVSYEGGVGWISNEFVTAFHVEIVPAVDPPRVALAPNPNVIPAPAAISEVADDRWIDLDLSEQRVTVYEDRKPVYQTLVSTGLPSTPTPTGQFRIWIKLRYDDMSGPDYYLEDVPYVMYFYQGYGFHGVWWHGNFGTPMSHGCVNLPNGADEWLFEWADVGTLVNIHD